LHSVSTLHTVVATALLANSSHFWHVTKSHITWDEELTQLLCLHSFSSCTIQCC